MTRAAVWAAAVWAALAAPAAAVECSDLTHEGNRYTVCEVDPAREDLRLFLYDDLGDVLGQFGAIDSRLQADGKALAFAMNAGMYHRDRAPVGHYVENGEELRRVIPNAGPGNFGMLPNGVFCIGEGRADVFETLDFVKQAPDCRFATQSGPMLVIDGALHPRFLPDSTSRYVRNGVGTSDDGQRVVFVISGNAVTFHEFGSLFRDQLGATNALYFDGNISRLYAPAIRRSDAGFAMGPIVGVVTDAQ
ncbi:phosphodiester glycosidase family protein [Arenibacterium halophilum]|uniref:Phosphodiester glycosidase domain-containing protein n=1 Tax=Arenibacterium halophilum TaxID=2583821 RepID=A0ABY2X624_9RHOB|nr:phosphodiester glycosidase family protein [Arenibacterium halophilum]TMV10478.1 hypothetical protein FGK64_16985 [Arenibacterium halophilum]